MKIITLKEFLALILLAVIAFMLAEIIVSAIKYLWRLYKNRE